MNTIPYEATSSVCGWWNREKLSPPVSMSTVVGLRPWIVGHWAERQRWHTIRQIADPRQRRHVPLEFLLPATRRYSWRSLLVVICITLVSKPPAFPPTTEHVECGVQNTFNTTHRLHGNSILWLILCLGTSANDFLDIQIYFLFSSNDIAMYICDSYVPD